MRITISGDGGLPTLVSHVKTLEDKDLFNISGLCRALGVPGSTFLLKPENLGLEAAIRHYLNEQRQRKMQYKSQDYSRLLYYEN